MNSKIQMPIEKLPRGNKPSSTKKQIGTVALIFVIVFVLAAYQVVAAAGLDFFVWGDHILGDSNYPIVMWALAGLLLGAACGSLVIWRKYHIPLKWCIATVAPVLLTLFLLQVCHGPLSSIAPRPLAETLVDSAKTIIPDTTPSVHRRKKHSAWTHPLADTVKQTGSTRPECAKQMAEVSINARADSVNVYYRTAAYQHGPWGAWKSKFIPQQGQFSLTEDGPVRANTLQYYYEARSVLTRSAQNPYTRTLCDGQLVIDTY
jgi:hypothetical protein